MHTVATAARPAAYFGPHGGGARRMAAVDGRERRLQRGCRANGITDLEPVVVLEILDLPVTEGPALVPERLLANVLISTRLGIQLHHQLAVVHFGVAEHDLVCAARGTERGREIGGKRSDAD